VFFITSKQQPANSKQQATSKQLCNKNHIMMKRTIQRLDRLYEANKTAGRQANKWGMFDERKSSHMSHMLQSLWLSVYLRHDSRFVMLFICVCVFWFIESRSRKMQSYQHEALKDKRSLSMGGNSSQQEAQQTQRNPSDLLHEATTCGTNQKHVERMHTRSMNRALIVLSLVQFLANSQE